MAETLPDFKRPPVTEVVLSIQFDNLESIRAPQLGSIWQIFRDRFPNTEEHPPLAPTIEQFGLKPGGQVGVQFAISPVPSKPRVWFVDKDGSELVQVQQDRFIRNWRRKETETEYPRYSALSEKFRQDYRLFRDLIEREQWGAIHPNQYEVTYVNIIPSGEGWENHGEMAQVLSVLSDSYSDDQFDRVEEMSVNLQYILHDEANNPAGRLYISANPVFLVSDNSPAIRLVLTARGRLEKGEIEEMMRSFDRGHKAIVRGFASVTTKKMHELWGRKP